MNQPEAKNNFPLLNTVSNKREQLEMASIDIDVLRAQAGSQDPRLAGISRRMLKTKWDLDPGHDAQNAKSVDITEQLASYSARELKTMLRNLVSIQLTEGCNGNCPWCLFGVKKGVTAKYSFESLRFLFQKNADVMSENPFLLYWDSDPFDYRDGDKRFVDVYKLYRETMPRNSQYISTAIPLGAEEDFVNFMVYVASEVNNESAVNRFRVPIRISLAEQNIQRVEATLLALTNELLKQKYTRQDINSFYGKVVTTVGRFGSFLLPIGPYINKADDVKNTFSTACRDGVVISPGSSRAVMMTAATIYNPSGQTEIELNPGSSEIFIPLKIREEHYANFTFGEKSLTRRAQLRQTMLPVIRHPNDEEFTLPNIFDDMILKSGREVASLSRLISNFSRVADLSVNSSDASREKTNFIFVSTEVFRERKKYTDALIKRMRDYCDKTSLQDEERKEIQYYMLLTQIHLAKMDFLASQVAQGQPIDVLSKMALVLTEVGRGDIDRLPAILDVLSEPKKLTQFRVNTRDKASARALIDNAVL